MLSTLLFYDRDGNVVGTIDYVVARDDDGHPIGLVDFEAHERAGGKMRDIADHMALDEPVPRHLARQVLGRDPGPREHIELPADHPYRVLHDLVAGSGCWPEWLGQGAHDFKVELRPGSKGGTPAIRALVHRRSGHRRERKAIEDAIALRQAAEANSAAAEGRDPQPVDIRDLVGGPHRPLRVDPDDGKTLPRFQVTGTKLPIRRARGR